MKKQTGRLTPHAFVLEEIYDLHPRTKPMFGTFGVYIGERIVFALRDRENSPRDNGMWICTVPEHHESLRKELPSMRSIEIFGEGVTGWQVIPADADDFEAAAMHVCELVRKKDPRIGKIPTKKIKKPTLKKSPKITKKKSKKKAKKK